MPTSRTLSLAQLTALPYSPAQLVQLAADVGCQACGIRLLPAAPGGIHHPLMGQPQALRETLACMRGTGVAVFDLEIIRIGPDFNAAHYKPLFDVGQQLGAKAILVAGDDPDHSRLAAHFASLCQAAAPYGLSADLEFMPWTAVRNIGQAASIVNAAAQTNGGVLVDAIHFSRSASTLAQVAALPRGALHYAQVCDGLVPGPSTEQALIHDARCERLLPGEGGINLAGLLAALPQDLPLSIEVPNDKQVRALGFEAWARAAASAARKLLAIANLARADSSAKMD